MTSAELWWQYINAPDRPLFLRKLAAAAESPLRLQMTSSRTAYHTLFCDLSKSAIPAALWVPDNCPEIICVHPSGVFVGQASILPLPEIQVEATVTVDAHTIKDVVNKLADELTKQEERYTAILYAVTKNSTNTKVWVQRQDPVVLAVATPDDRYITFGVVETISLYVPILPEKV